MSDYQLRSDENDEDAEILVLTPLYALSPKGGGPASVFDSGTWYDRSMARQRVGIVADRLRKDRRSNLFQQVLRLGFVIEEKLYWSDGSRVDGERLERRRMS